MSLINDALKRAQRQRTGPDSAPAAGTTPFSGPRRTATPGGPWLMIAAGALGGGVVALVVILALRPKPDNPPAGPAVPAPATAAVTSGSQADPAPPPTTLRTPPHNELAPPLLAAAPVEQAATAVPVVPGPPAATTVPAGPARPSAEFVATVEALRVAGIRAAGADSKVLINDRVYRPGEIVQHELRIRLTGVTSNSLTFEQEGGGTYTRNFN